MFRQTSRKTFRSQNSNRLNSQCSRKSSQHNVVCKDVAVKTYPLKVSSIFTNTSEFGTHDHGYLQRKQKMSDESSKIHNPRNIRQNFRSNPKKYDDFETYEYQTLQRPKVKRRDISFDGLYNNRQRSNGHNSPHDEGSCQKAFDTSNFCHCISKRKEKNTKQKPKNTCLCYATGDYKDDNVENIDSEYPKKVRNKNKVQHISNILDKNKIGLDICKEGLCAQTKKQKDNTFSFKYITGKDVGKVPAKCVDSTCDMTDKIKMTKVKLKDKVIHLGNKHSQKLGRLRYPSFQNENSKQNTFVKGTYDDVLLNKTPGFVYKCTNKDENKDSTDATCNVLKNRYASKSKQAQTFRRESHNKKTGLKHQTKNRFLRCCIAFKAKFHKDIPKNHKIETCNANNIPNDLKKQISLDSKRDQTGEPFFDIKVNSIDMRTLNPDEVRNKVLALGKQENRKTCICPSHNTKKANYLLKTACPGGVCKKAFQNKKTNFSCTCANRKVKTCTDTTCELNGQKTQISSWPINNNNPIFEMKLDSHNMNVLNTHEIRSKMQDIEKLGKIDKCPSGACEAVTNKARYICKCFHRKRLIEMDECSEDICRQTNLIKVRNKKNNIKSKISCICAQILSKSEIWSRQTFNKIKRTSSNIAKNHNDILNKNQGVKINFIGKNVDAVTCDNTCLDLTEPCIYKKDKDMITKENCKNDKSINKRLHEKGDFGLITNDVLLQTKQSVPKIDESKLHNTDNKENIHRYCNCCVCDIVKSDCKCINTSRRLKCTDILFRSCSNLFCGHGLRKRKYQRKRLILKTKKEKINMPPSFKNTHAYTEKCICCLCGQRTRDCMCKRSLRTSKCKYIFCKSFSRLMQSHRQSVTYPENVITANRTQIHKRKSISFPIEKNFYRVKSHNTQYNNSRTNKKVKPISLSFNNKYQRNISEVTEPRKKRKHAYKYNAPIPEKKRQESMHDETKTKVSEQNKKQHQSIIPQRDKGERICLCTHTCECESLTRRNRLKHGHKKRKLVSKRQKLKRQRRSESQKQKHNKKRGLKRKKVSLADEKKFRKEIAKKEMVKNKKRLKRQKLEKKQLEAISKGQEEVEETSCIADFFLALFKIGFCIIKGFGVVLFKLITDPKASIRYTKQRLRDPVGTYERIKKAFLEFWGLKKLQMEKSIAGSEKMSIMSDTLQNTAFYQAFAEKGKTKKEKKLIDYKNKKRRKRITKRDKEAMHGCRHMLLHTLRKTPCMWVYHVCPHFYPQCLSCLAFWHNFSNLLLFLLAFIVWTPCIVCFEGFRALSCCLLCTG